MGVVAEVMGTGVEVSKAVVAHDVSHVKVVSQSMGVDFIVSVCVNLVVLIDQTMLNTRFVSVCT